MPTNTRNKSVTASEDNLQTVMDICNRVNNKLDKVVDQLNKLESRLSSMEQIQSSLSTQFQNLNSRVTNIESEQSSQAESLTYLHKDMDDAKNEITKLHATLSGLTKTNSIMDGLKTSVNRLEQEKSYRNLLISGIPKTNHEDLVKIITTLASKTNITLAAADVTTAYRTKSINIYVQFNSQVDRDKLYNSRKILQRERITTKSLGYQSDGKIYFNEILDDKQRELFYKARCKRKEANYLYIWTFHSIIYMKKTKDSSLCKITSDADLDSLS